jgi:hypothetical protein
VFAYSDVEQAVVMHKVSIALAAGADFTLFGPKRTMLATGVGKSQTARWLAPSEGARPESRGDSDALRRSRAPGGATLCKPR